MENEKRAMQIWQILVGAAHNRQTLTYKQVAGHLGFKKGENVLAQSLCRIMKYCEAQKLPPLTCLVVNKKTGLPGTGLTTIQNLPTDREAVYRQNWFALPPVQIPNFEPDA